MKPQEKQQKKKKKKKKKNKNKTNWFDCWKLLAAYFMGPAKWTSTVFPWSSHYSKSTTKVIFRKAKQNKTKGEKIFKALKIKN